ncbi:hypothetical protein BH09MYX1_BH09MYX1_41970 [soil metagenome]
MRRTIAAVVAIAILGGCAPGRGVNAPNAAPKPLPAALPKPSDRANVTETATTCVHPTVDPESSMPTVGGWVRVHASLSEAYAIAIRFGEIKELNPYIEQSTVVDKHPEIEATDVYLRIPTFLHEYVWALIRFRPVSTGPDPSVTGYAYRGDEIDGNLDDLRIDWRLVPDGSGDTLAQIELLADPRLPLPRGWLIPELREGVGIMLDRFRTKAEAGR